MKTILLDYDGVIRYLKGVDHLLEPYNLNLEELMNALFDNDYAIEFIEGRLDEDEWWNKICDNPVLKDISYSFVFEVLFSNSFVDTHLSKYIDSLSSEFQLAIFSNATDKSLELIKKQVKGYHFDHIMVSSQFGYAKPKPEAFQAALKKMKCTPDEIIFFDDSQRNVDGAREIGIKAYLFEGIEQLQKLIKNFQEIQ